MKNETEIRRVSDLVPDPKNANRGTKRGQAMLESSLRQHGAGRSILLDRLGRIIAGNKTAQKAAEIGIEDVEIVRSDGTRLVAVQRTDLDLDDPEARLLAYADNRVSEVDLDFDPARVIADAQAGLDLSSLWSSKEMQVLLAKAGALGAVDPGADLGRADDLVEKWGVQLGQLWTIPSANRSGECHRLVCGDSTDPQVAALALDGARPKLMVTDPPYGVEYDAGWRDKAALDGRLLFSRPARREYIKNDDRADWSDAWKLFPGDVAYIWHASLHAIEVLKSIEVVGFETRALIVWVKPMFVISRGHYNWAHEPCLYAVRGGADPAWKGLPEPDPEWKAPEYLDAHNTCAYAVRGGATASWIGDNSQSTVWKISLDKTADGGHSTQKPLECMARPIRNHDGDVYEPFAGSGTTIVAAEQLSRICYAIDLLPACCAITLERLAGMELAPALAR